MVALAAQTFVVGQAVPATAGHASHAPALQTRFVPHVVPSTASPVSLQLAAGFVAVGQTVDPVWQVLGSVQGAPSTQGDGRHAPDEQDPVPQVAGSVTLASAVQIGTPVLHLMVADATQAFARVHGAVAGHGVQVPW